MYEIFSGRKPFKKLCEHGEMEVTLKYELKKLKSAISTISRKGIRPELNESVPEYFRQLIEKCWSNDPKMRPTIDEILIELKTNSMFINEKINKDEFYKYVKIIDDSKVSFESNQELKAFDEFFNSRSHLFHKSYIDLRKRGSLNIDSNLNLDKYSQIDRIKSVGDFNYLKIAEKETNLKFTARVFLNEISKLCRNEVKIFVHTINTISQLNHPCILKFVGYSPTDFNNRPYPVIVTENIYIKLRDSFGGHSVDGEEIYLDDTKRLIIIYGIASAMSYLHSNGIIHRDLKTSNIYLDEHLFPKIGGFDISKEIGEKEKYKSQRIKGTPAYLSPEIYEKQEYSRSSDVYAFSHILFEIFTKEKPHHDKISSNEIKNKIINEHQRPTSEIPIPSIYMQLIERCWSTNPKDRPTFSNIVTELKTNPKYITDTVDKEDFFEFVSFLDEFDYTFKPNDRIKELDDIVSTKLHTFPDIQPKFNLKNIYATEKNDLSFNSDNIKISKLTYIDFITCGCFYSVSKLVDPISNVEYANKTTNFKSFYKNDLINFSREINIIKQLNHPAILKFIGYKNFDLNGLNTYFDILFEYSTNGTLSKMIEFEKQNENELKLDDTKRLIIIYGIASAMSYLHSNGIIHRDLKTSNIYLDEHLFPKIGGFDISKEIGEKEKYKSQRIKGTPAYLSPEIYEKQEYSRSSELLMKFLKLKE